MGPAWRVIGDRRLKKVHQQTACCPAHVQRSSAASPQPPCMVEQATVLPCDVSAALLCTTWDLPPSLRSSPPFSLIHVSLDLCSPLSIHSVRK